VRVLSVLFLLILGSALVLANESNQSITAEQIAQQQELKVEKQNLLTTQLKSIQKEIKSISSEWKSSVENYTQRSQATESLKRAQAALQRERDSNSSKTEEIRSLKKQIRVHERKIAKIDPSSYGAVLYYLDEINHDLNVHSDLHLKYESKSSDLQRLRYLYQKTQKTLKDLLLLDPNNKELTKAFKLNEKRLNTIDRLLQRIKTISDARLTAINDKLQELSELNTELGDDNIWQKSYSSYLAYIEVQKDLARLDKQIEVLKSKESKSMQEIEEQNSLMAKRRILSEQIELLQTKGTSPFTELLKPDEIAKIPDISNPFDIFTAISFNKKMRSELAAYKARESELKRTLKILQHKRALLKDLLELDNSDELKQQIQRLDYKIDKFRVAHSTLIDTASVYEKHVEEIETKVSKKSHEQTMKLIKIGSIILFLLLFFFMIKQILKRYISDNDRFYMANKGLTFTVVMLIVIVLLFNYIENASYIVTVLGFASAGIAIAMKDWFMSILGWLVIVFGGSIHVGDRVKVVQDGVEYVGDVLDISLLRITILEDITLTTYMHNRRAGRIIFIPNNYVFTNMIANYTHISLKTVWDGIDITITFDSNHKKAQHIAKEISRKFAKGYTDITRKQLNKLRSGYSLKNTNVEPRIFTFAEENGIRVSCWYLTNAYATLTLRSTISMEIIDAFNSADDIQIAYPTQMLHIKNAQKRVPPFDPNNAELV